MTNPERSVAMPEKLNDMAIRHLLRSDGQEDLCFALWYPSRGQNRTSALIQHLVLPDKDDRNIHGNVSFNPEYFVRALSEATAKRAGLALMHSHPDSHGWQNMSLDDVSAERGCAGAVYGATGLPFLGLTLAGDKTWSARFWEHTDHHTYIRHWCVSVRIVGDRLSTTFMDDLLPPQKPTEEQVRTVSAWGEKCHSDLVRLRVGIVGTGSVGGIIAEAVARTGFQDILLIDFDRIEKHNLDRLQYATRDDIGHLKVEALSEYLQKRGTAEQFQIKKVFAAVFEEEGYRRALDCDLLFSCVDRPWGRHVLNLIAYAHLIPVIDGGIAVRTNRSGKISGADWRAHIATNGRPCLQCLGQYDPGLVQAEREGLIDDPQYISGLPKGHPLKVRENVFSFSLSCASLQMLQMLSLVLSPLDQPNPGAQLYHFVGGFMEKSTISSCHTECLFPSLVALGDSSNFSITGTRPTNI